MKSLITKLAAVSLAVITSVLLTNNVSAQTVPTTPGTTPTTPATDPAAQTTTGGGGFPTDNFQTEQPQFGAGEIQIEDTRRTSINDNQAAGVGGQNFGGQGGAANPFQALFGGGFGQGGFGQGGFGQGFGQSNQRIVRSPLVVDFDRPAASRVSTAELASRVTSSFSRQPRFRGDSVIATSFGDTLVLTGTVDSQRKKASAARIARLQPGVENVDNRLVVVGSQ